VLSSKLGAVSRRRTAEARTCTITDSVAEAGGRAPQQEAGSESARPFRVNTVGMDRWLETVRPLLTVRCAAQGKCHPRRVNCACVNTSQNAAVRQVNCRAVSTHGAASYVGFIADPPCLHHPAPTPRPPPPTQCSCRRRFIFQCYALACASPLACTTICRRLFREWTGQSLYMHIHTHLIGCLIS